jgi:hypothetical protein
LQTYYFLPINDKTPKLFCGNSLDIKTYGQRAKVINDMITYIDTEISIIRTRISNNIDNLETERGNRINDIREFTGFDYLKRKLTLQKIIAENRIVAITQFFIIFLFLPTLGVGDVAVIPKAFGTLTLGKSTKVWLITKVCFDAFTRHIRLHNVGGSLFIIIVYLSFIFT